ncbi:ubiquinol-cytochrome c reductase core subunit 1 [Coemansia sp. Benny D115]|nr:ubiquinol-cytochrome c reductase core subunit 1 [Coemansia sp. Benny D115]
MFQPKAFAKLAAPLASRTYASVASAPVVSAANGIKVAAVAGSADSPLASVSLVINAGSRFETASTSGAAHYLKTFGFRNTQTRTSFRTVREAELNGATLTAEATRENITYTVQCFKEAVPYFVEVLGDIAAATRFTEHEFSEVSRLVAFESLSARLDPVTRALDGVHQAAFRSGLGNSLYALESSPVSTGDAVRQYAQAALAPSRVAIVATGVDAQQLANLVESSRLSALVSSSSVLSTTAAKFNGGAQQIYDSAAPVSHYALAFSTEPAAAQPLAALLGAQSRTKWTTGVSPLAKLSAAEGFGVAPFSFAYSDAGLVGVLVSAPNTSIKAAVEKVAATIQKDIAAAAPEAVQRATAATRLDVAEALATQKGQIRALSNIAFGQSAATLESVDEAATKLSSDAARVFKSKPVAVSIGLSQETAYVDTLGF